MGGLGALSLRVVGPGFAYKSSESPHSRAEEDTVVFNIGQGKPFKAIRDAVAAQMAR